MKRITEWHKGPPQVQIPQEQLVKQLVPIELVAFLSRLAIAAASDTFIYAMRRLARSLKQAERIKKFCKKAPPEAEAAYQQLSEQYSALMENVLQQVSARLLETLE